MLYDLSLPSALPNELLRVSPKPSRFYLPDKALVASSFRASDSGRYGLYRKEFWALSPPAWPMNQRLENAERIRGAVTATLAA